MKKFLLFFFIACIGRTAVAQVPSYVATAGLLAWYPFNDNALNAYSALDNGVAYGGVSYGTDRYGSALSCYVGDGASGIDIPGNNFVTGNGSRSVASWYKMPLPAPSGNRELFATGDNSMIGARFGLNTDVTWIGWESVGIGVDRTLPIDSSWHHIVVTYPAAGAGSASIKLYFDGALSATFTVAGTTPIFNTVAEPIHYIGTLFMPLYSGSWLYSWIGSLDDMGVWDREITPCEVAYLYYAGNSTLGFANGPSDSIDVCENAATFSLGTTLAVNDSDVGLTDTWSAYAVPVHGTLTAAYTTTSTGSTMTPAGVSYTPTPGYVGPDSFKVIVHDCGNTSDTITVYVTVIPLPLAGSLSGPSVVCEGSTITLTPTVTGGGWSAANPNATVAGGVVTGVSAGVDDIIYSVSNSCGASTVSQTITVNPTPPPPTITGAAAYCQYAAYVPPVVTGTDVLWYTAPMGGTGSLVAPTIGTSIAGTYNYWATQTLLGCESPRALLSISVNPIPPTPVISDAQWNYCQGQPFMNFTIVSGTGVLWYATPTGGVGSGISPAMSTALAGPQTVWVSQTVLGCESSRLPVTIYVYDSVMAAFSPLIKYGCKADTVAFTNTSISATYYSWSFGDAGTSAVISPTHIYPVQDTYAVKLIVNNGHCFDSSTQIINLVHPLHAAFADSPGLLCQGSTVTFTDASIATTPTHFWNFGDGITAISNNPSHSYPRAGIYKAFEVVTDFVPCTDTAYQVINVDSQSLVHIAVTDTVICVGTNITFTGNYSSIGDTGVAWALGNGDSIKDVNPLSYGFETPGFYAITCTPMYRVCGDSSATRTITVLPVPVIDLGPDTAICKGGGSLIIGDILHTTAGPATWQWNTGQTASRIAVAEPGEYTVTVKVGGCTATSSIVVSNDCYMNIPNAFTPNGDGINDYFFPRLLLTSGLTTFKMDIYNRWGELIFETTTTDGKGWDGKFNNTDQPEGVFVYIIDAAFKDGQEEHHQGNVSLIR